MPNIEDVFCAKLQLLAEQHRQRKLVECERIEDSYIIKNAKKLLSFSCNDYLGLSHSPQLKQAAIAAVEKYGSGCGASRLVTGNHPLYSELEAKLAKFKGTESALVFGSGYLANIGVIPALVDKNDLIIADKLVHACLIDGAKLSGAKFVRFKHNDLQDLQHILSANRHKFRHCLIITDEVFSMDGDLAPLGELSTIAKQHDAWLMADAAHSLSPLPSQVDIYVGTLSKAFASYGGFVCGKKVIIDYLISSSRSFMFSTGLPPASIAASIAALDIITKDPALLQKPIENARIFTSAVGLPPAESPIVPIILGDEEKAIAASAVLESHGYAVSAIRPPTVPPGTSRLRFAFSSLHKCEDIYKVGEIVRDLR